MTIDNHKTLNNRLFIDYQYQSINWHRFPSIVIDCHRSSISSIGNALTLETFVSVADKMQSTVKFNKFTNSTNQLSRSFFTPGKSLGNKQVLSLNFSSFMEGDCNNSYFMLIWKQLNWSKEFLWFPNST